MHYVNYDYLLINASMTLSFLDNIIVTTAHHSLSFQRKLPKNFIVTDQKLFLLDGHIATFSSSTPFKQIHLS